jgi:hypothetical protein
MMAGLPDERAGSGLVQFVRCPGPVARSWLIPASFDVPERYPAEIANTWTHYAAC